MNELIGSFWWLIVTIGVLVTFHEFGHYIVARWCGVKVLRFSVGFGRSLWSRTDKHGTEFRLAIIPLGGYVKMLDERDEHVTPAERSLAFNQQPVGKRIAIIAAGPMANLLLCLVFYWGMFVAGKPDYVPLLGEATGIAAQAGIHEGDTLMQVDGTKTPTLTQTVPPLMLAAIDRRDVNIVLQDASGKQRNSILRLSQLPADFDQTRIFQAIGIKAAKSTRPAIVDFLAPGGAAVGRLQVGDRITKIGAIEITDAAQLAPAVVKQARPDQALSVLFLRDGQTRQVMIQPKQVSPEPGLLDKTKTLLGMETKNSQPEWKIGVGSASTPPKKTILRYGPIESIGKAFQQTWETTRTTFAMLKRLISGEASAKNVSGTITVAQVANQEANTSFGSFLGFLAFFSLSLCIMNLLPIPVLDGGHLMYYLIELVTGHPVAERVQMAGQFIGLALLAGLMLLAHYNDFARLFSN
ncbi:MAG TPA: RIP metalloprotease RseP [Arenimonas sp.]|nr:RIP metalloprotease RseP [Arenimonas sp.]HOZ05173.1 RIP metalloprotease RseP [Arenimonas sp.]HPW31800.1 RIP metalloprotease RseP [Arenimonas sp.]